MKLIFHNATKLKHVIRPHLKQDIKIKRTLKSPVSCNKAVEGITLSYIRESNVSASIKQVQSQSRVGLARFVIGFTKS